MNNIRKEDRRLLQEEGSRREKVTHFVRNSFYKHDFILCAGNGANALNPAREEGVIEVGVPIDLRGKMECVSGGVNVHDGKG
jgi:hypothetical protein